MPQISVIIPSYNTEKTIRETIESVLNQTFPDFELIVINDGSTDSTLDIIASITDPRLKVFSYPNSGVSISRNRGFSHSSGEFITFLDADDLWTPDKLEAQLKALQENPKTAVAYSWTAEIDEIGQHLGTGCDFTKSGDVYESLLLVNFLASGSNPLIRRQALMEVGGFEQSLTPAEDWHMYLRLAARYHFIAVPYPHVLYRKSPSSASCNLSKLEAACLRVLERAYSHAPESIHYLNLKRLSFGFVYKILIQKAFEGPPGRHKGLKAAKLLWNYIRKDPFRYQMKKFKLSLLSKVMQAILLPHHQPKLEW